MSKFQLLSEITQLDVKSTIQAVNEFLGDNGKGIELLKKSYNRLSITFKAEQIFGSTEQPVIKSKKKSKGWTIIGALAVSDHPNFIAIIFSKQERKVYR